MTTPTDDGRDLLTVIAHVHAAPGKRDELWEGLTVDLVLRTA